jgi:two-component response regulator ARR-B family
VYYITVLSANDTKETVMKGVMHGACDYLIKPVRFEELSVIWMHVARRQKSCEEYEDALNFNHTKVGEHNAQTGQRGTRSGSHTRTSAGKRRKEDSDDDDSDEMEDDENSTKKKARVVWSPDLHCKFVNAVSEIGVDSMFLINF